MWVHKLDSFVRLSFQINGAYWDLDHNGQDILSHFTFFQMLVFFQVLKQVPAFFSCLGEHCEAQKYFVEFQTSPDFPSEWW